MSTPSGVGTFQTVVCPNCQTRNRVPVARSGYPRCGTCKSPLPWVVDASDSDFSEIADHATLPVLVDLWAPWCGPCRMVTPVLEQLATEMAGKLKLVKVNADEAPHLSRRFDAQAIPTLLVMKNGQIVEKQVGAAPAHVLRRWLQDALDNSTGQEQVRGQR
jgi:thioredoxin 2